MNRRPRALAGAAGLAFALAATGCTAAGGPGQAASGADTAVRTPAIVVGSFNFPRRPTGAPPPLPRRITVSTTAWLLLVVITARWSPRPR